MFREMRRSRQVLKAEDVAAVMARCTNGILACLGDDGYPYAVPVSFVYFNDKVYFHSAKAGHKIDAIQKNPKVSFAVVDEDMIVGKEFTTYFRSVIAFGQARIAQGDERRQALTAMTEKYSGDLPQDARQQAVDRCANALVMAIDIEHLTGKEAIEFVNARK